MVDVVIISDSADRVHWFRGIGPYRIATEIRNHNFSCQVLDFCGFYNFDTWCKLVDVYVNEETKIIGISSNWMAIPNLLGGRYTGIMMGEGVETKFDTDDIYTQSFSFAFTFDAEQRFVNYIKQRSPNAKIIMGGARSVDFIKKDWVDHIFLGFSESQLIDYLKNYKTKEYPRLINWDIESSKNWDFTCSGYIKYSENDFIMPGETLPLEIGRGCIFKCKFCSFPLLGKKKGSYIKDPAIVYDELMENYNRWGTTNYVISDETFNDNIDKLRSLRDVIKRLPFKTNFWAFCRLELVGAHPEQIQLLLDIGLREMQYGMETLNDQTAKAISKGLPAEQKKEILKFAKLTWKDKVRIKANFIVGLPYETKESIIKTAEWILSDNCPIDFASLFPYILYKRDENTHLKWNSVFEKEYEKWGYYFKDGEDSMHWYKNDDTDIDSFMNALKFSKIWQDKILKRNLPTEMFYYSNDKWHGLTLDELLKLDQSELHAKRNSLPNGPGPTLFDQVNNLYVKNHLKINTDRR
jgi:radical SAM superfamily enzyme YgiQ (UPF0313 family)